MGEVYRARDTALEGDVALKRSMCVATVDPISGARVGEPTLLFDAAKLGFLVITFGERGYDVLSGA